jgi:hypothetical protein
MILYFKPLKHKWGLIFDWAHDYKSSYVLWGYLGWMHEMWELCEMLHEISSQRESIITPHLELFSQMSLIN